MKLTSSTTPIELMAYLPCRNVRAPSMESYRARIEIPVARTTAEVPRRWSDPLFAGGPLRETSRRTEARHHSIVSPSNGFSLIELVLVVAIMAIFAAIAAPRYGRASGRYRLDLAARRVAADLRMAQSVAKAASTSCTVIFTTGTDQYQLVGVPAPDGQAGDYTVHLSDEPYKADLLEANFNNTAQVVFNGWGLPAHGGAVTLAAGSQQKTVTVDATTGQVNIQ